MTKYEQLVNEAYQGGLTVKEKHKKAPKVNTEGRRG